MLRRLRLLPPSCREVRCVGGVVRFVGVCRAVLVLLDLKLGCFYVRLVACRGASITFPSDSCESCTGDELSEESNY
jgi:hypothetical protein